MKTLLYRVPKSQLSSKTGVVEKCTVDRGVVCVHSKIPIPGVHHETYKYTEVVYQKIRVHYM